MGTSPNASTFTSDIGSATRLATSAPFYRYLTESIFQQSAFVQSGILATDSRMNNLSGVRVELPFFNPLDYTEESVDSSATWGTNGAGFYTTQKQTASTQYGSFTNRGAAFAMDFLSEVQTDEDALENIRSQLSTDMARKLEQKLIYQLTGLFGAGGPLNATNSLDLSETTPGSVTDANYLSAASITQAKYLLSERANNLNSIAMHPTVAAYLEQIGQLTFSSSSLTPGAGLTWGGGGIGITDTQIGWMSGLKVVVDSQMPVLGSSGEAPQYVCYLFADGVVKTGSQFPLMIEFDRNILSIQTAMAVTYSNLMHILGTTWSASFDNPTNAQLATPANWSLAYEVPQMIECVRLVVNSPYGTTIP